jgi:recombination protein U
VPTNANKASLGKEWENELNATHEWYRLQGLADIVKNEHEWVFITERQHGKKSAKYDRRMFATTDAGQRMMRSRGDIDYSGGGRGFTVCFDAKKCQGRSFPLSNVSYHQIRRLLQSKRCGVVSGFLIKLSDIDRVFFVDVELMRDRYEAWQSQAVTKRGTASLSIEDLEQCVEVFRNKQNGLWDWLPRLLQSQ